jgi:phospholipase C
MHDVHCEKSSRPGYVDHTLDSANLAEQLQSAGLTWKGYYESIPAAGSLAVVGGDAAAGPGGQQWELYASKHSGFMNYRSVQRDPRRAVHIVGFDALDRDLASGTMPAFALIVPNQCNDMHGLDPADYTGVAANVPEDCNHRNIQGLIHRGDATIGRLLSKMQRSPIWNSPQNTAVVITFDEGENKADGGGGHIPTLVITNHGPHAVKDSHAYTHYSLLRTIEDAFGFSDYLGQARSAQPMTPLFRLP